MDFEQALELKFKATLSKDQQEHWDRMWGDLASSEIEMLWDWLIMGCEMARAHPERELN
jgi:hypothetical protein